MSPQEIKGPISLFNAQNALFAAIYADICSYLAIIGPKLALLEVKTVPKQTKIKKIWIVTHTQYIEVKRGTGTTGFARPLV